MRAKRRIKIPSHPTSDDSSLRSEQSPGRIFGLGGLVIELVLPATLSAALLLVLASYTSYWDIRTPIGLEVFGFLLVASSLLTSLKVDAFTLARRRRSGKRRLLNRADTTSRLVKFLLGGVVIPVATLTAANLLVLPNHQTPMTMASLAVRSKLAGPDDTRAAQLGNALLRARTPATRVQGIQALQAMSSVQALDQLLRMLGDDATVLKSGSEAQALSAALASYGLQAKVKLLQRFNGVPPIARLSAPAPPSDQFAREIDGRSPDPAARASEKERPTATQEESKPASGQSETQPVQGPASLPSFIMQTFLQMDLKEDSDLLAFARQTAADDGWSEAVRGQALLLTAKLGGKDDLDGLFTYLDSPSLLLQAHAMRAIAALQSKLSAAATKG